MNKKTKFTTALIVALSVSLIEPSFADENSKPADNINLKSSSRPSNNSNTNEIVTPHKESSENATLEAKFNNQKTTTSKSQSLPFNENFSANAESQKTASEQDKSTEANEEYNSNVKLDNNKDEVVEANHNTNENYEENETVNSSDEDLDKKTSDTAQEQSSPDSHTEEISKSENENDIEESKKENEQSNKQIQKSAPKNQSLEVSEIEKKEALTSSEQNTQGSYVLSNDDDNTSVNYENFADLRNALLNLNGNNTLTLNKDLVITDKDNPDNKYSSDFLLKVGKEDSDVNLTIKSSGSEKRKIIYDSSNSKTPPYKRPYSLIGAKYKNTKLTLDNITLDGGNFLGGVTAEKGADVTIKNSLIENCSGRSSGGILLREYKISDDEINKLTIIDSIIQNCLASSCGGAILAENNSIINAKNSKFLNNDTSTGDGGAIGLKGDKETSDNITATVDNCTFENNKKGAIVSRSEKTLTIKNSTFKNNKSIHNGGAISMNSGNVVVDNSIFEGNETAEKGFYMGGAIFINNNYYGKITNSTFKKNKSIKNHGGAIASRGSLEIKNSTFEENTAKKDGGAIYVNIGTENGDVDAKIDINNITVNNNKAENGKGGGLYLAINDLYYNAGKGEFLGRHNTIKHSIITNNEAKFGGGLYLSEIGADIEYTKILNNTYTAQGGGIFAIIDKQFPDGNTNDIKLVNSEIKNNKIKEDSIGNDIKGGGAYISKGNIVTNNSKIEANEAQYGGGVYLKGDSKLKSTSSSFKDNKASQDGGAIFTEIHSYGKDERDANYRYPPLPGKHYTNIEVDENSEFDGNTARKFFKEPYNYKEFSKIKSQSQTAPKGDIAKHIINNYDINFRVYPIISFNLNDTNQEKQELDKKIILEEGEILKQDKFPTEDDLSNVKNKIFVGWSFDKDAKPTDTDKLITGDNPIFRQKLTKDGKEIDTDEITIYAIWQTKTKVSYTYVSDDPKVELPTEILNSKPRDQEVEYGTEIDPTKLVKFTEVEGEIDGRKGKWILKNWDPGTTTLNEKEHKDGLTFIATWKFEEDKPNPYKPNPDNPNPDKPNPDEPNPDEPNPDKPNKDSSTPDNQEIPKDSETSNEDPKDDDNQEDTPHQKDIKDTDKNKTHKINNDDAHGVKTKKSTNPKTGIDSIVPIITSMGISITGILATRKRKEN